MKSVFLVTLLLTMSACGKTGDQNGEDLDSEQTNAVIIHNISECPDLNGTYTHPVVPSFEFSKDANGNLQSTFGGQIAPIDGKLMTVGAQSITLSCMQGAFIMQLSGTENGTLRMRSNGSYGMTVSKDGSTDTLFYTKQL